MTRSRQIWLGAVAAAFLVDTGAVLTLNGGSMKEEALGTL